MSNIGNFYKIDEFGFEKGKSVLLRLQMLFCIFDRDSDKKYNVLDIGCAEAMVCKVFGEHFNLYDGVDLDPERLVMANKVLNKYVTCPYSLKRFDFNTKSKLGEFNADKNLNQYDVVLYLGIHHHIKNAIRQKALSFFLDMSNDWFAIRSDRCRDRDSLRNIDEHGFDLYFKEPIIVHRGAGFIFRRRK